MLGSFRLAMVWVHTWFGLFCGFALLAMFFFGSLSVFASEIDRWSQPATRFAGRGMPSFDHTLRPMLEKLQPDAAAIADARQREHVAADARLVPTYWSVAADPNSRALGMSAQLSFDPNREDEGESVSTNVDGTTLEALTVRELALGADLFFPLHFTLVPRFHDQGILVAGFLAFLMLVALVSGVVIHRKLFREFFTFRPEKAVQRSLLDLHDLTGVVALPFHFVFTFTGLLILMDACLPIHEGMLERVRAHDSARRRDSSASVWAHAASTLALAPVDPMFVEAKRRWAERGMPTEIASIEVHRPFSATGKVMLFPARGSRVALGRDGYVFDAQTGRLLNADPEPQPAVEPVVRYLEGIHMMTFAHAPFITQVSGASVAWSALRQAVSDTTMAALPASRSSSAARVEHDLVACTCFQ